MAYRFDVLAFHIFLERSLLHRRAGDLENRRTGEEVRDDIASVQRETSDLANSEYSPDWKLEHIARCRAVLNLSKISTIPPFENTVVNNLFDQLAAKAPRVRLPCEGTPNRQ